MPLDKNWASPEDFATLFQYFWYRDFPIDQKATGAHRADWTIHIGVVVRNIADLMGLVTRFEGGGRTDAMLRSSAGDEIAIEWEWKDTWREELAKLKNHGVWSQNENINRPLKYVVLITYTPTEDIVNVYRKVVEIWEEAKWPLLLILVDVLNVPKSKIASRREFRNMQMVLFDKNGRKEPLRIAPALPWNVSGTRWSVERVGL